MDCLFVPLLNQEHNNPFFPQGDLELKFPPISKEKKISSQVLVFSHVFMENIFEIIIKQKN